MRSRMNGLRSARRAPSSAETTKRNWCGSFSERSRKAPPSSVIAGRVVETARRTFAGHAVAHDVLEVRPRGAEVAGNDARVARLDDDAPAAGRDQAGGGAHAGAHAALGRRRRDVASLPQRAGAVLCRPAETR